MASDNLLAQPLHGAFAVQVEDVPCPSCSATESRQERRLAGYRLVRCRACSLVFVNPRPTPAALTSIYMRKDAEAQARFYARTVSPAQIWEYSRILEDIVGIVGGGGRLIDLGCAAGYFMQQATKAGFDAHGVDLAAWVAGTTAQRGIPNVHIGRLADAAFQNSWADVVHSSQVLEHLPNPHDELKEIRRILRPGGVLYLNVPNYQCLSIVAGKDDFELNMPPEHVSYFTPKTLSGLLTGAGFKVIRTSTYGGLKWENLLGRPIRSEIAEAVRVRSDSTEVARAATGMVRRHGTASRFLRRFVYRHLKVGMTLEIFAARP